MSVQDDAREKELAELFDLIWDKEHARGGVDAHLILPLAGDQVKIEIELKSTTTGALTTARDVGPNHFEKWRNKMWIVGIYSDDEKPELRHAFCLMPEDMEEWIAGIEDSVLIDRILTNMLSKSPDLAFVHAIFGDHPAYRVDEAKMLCKKMFTNAEYEKYCDVDDGGEMLISPEGMVKLVQLRCEYLLARGTTINNPKVGGKYFKRFEQTNRMITENHAANLRSVVAEYLTRCVDHPFERMRESLNSTKKVASEESAPFIATAVLTDRDNYSKMLNMPLGNQKA